MARKRYWGSLHGGHGGGHGGGHHGGGGHHYGGGFRHGGGGWRGGGPWYGGGWDYPSELIIDMPDGCPPGYGLMWVKGQKLCMPQLAGVGDSADAVPYNAPTPAPVAPDVPWYQPTIGKVALVGAAAALYFMLK